MGELLNYLETIDNLTPEQKLAILSLAKEGGGKLLLTIDEASKLTGIGTRTLREIAKRRDFPKMMIGTKTMIIRDNLAEWLRKNTNRYF